MNKEQVRKLAAQAGYDVDKGGIYLDETSYYSEEARLTEFARLVELATKESAIHEDKLAEFKCGDDEEAPIYLSKEQMQKLQHEKNCTMRNMMDKLLDQ